MKITLYYNNECGHCRRFHKTIDNIASERPHIDVSKVEYVPSIHTDVMFIPTMIVSHGGRELGRFSSALEKKTISIWLDQLDEYIKTHLYSNDI
ncbi:thioredoxin family protein [Paenibacillus sp. VT-400]|uniref:thioredoxin family protein n=1 Tax=unclassified Paenibacillus TaxID=185978 RepID=UPI0009E1A422